MKKILLYSLIFLIAIQLIPLDRSNPTFDKKDEIEADNDIKKILKKSCYDCHSNQTKWSIYSYIAPLSWGVYLHVKKGREALNFSTWKKMDKNLKKLRIDRMDRVILNGMMPKSSYTLFHPETELSSEEKEKLVKWVREELKK